MSSNFILWLPQDVVEGVDRFVDRGLFGTRSDFVRDSIRHGLIRIRGMMRQPSPGESLRALYEENDSSFLGSIDLEELNARSTGTIRIFVSDRLAESLHSIPLGLYLLDFIRVCVIRNLESLEMLL